MSRREPRDFAAQYGRAVVDLRRGDRDAGRDARQRLAEAPNTPRTFRDRAEGHRGQRSAGRSRRRGALPERASRTLDEDMKRTLEVKAMAARDPAARAPMSALLLGAPDRGPEPMLAGARLGAWSARTGDPMADYVLGKNIARKGWPEEAAPYLTRALAAGAPTPAIHRELLRVEAQIACATRSAARLERVRRELAGPANPFPRRGSGRLEAVQRLLDRCIVD